MPTSRPRYQITDTGQVSEMIDAASLRWPELRDRKALLMQLVAAGAAQLAADVDHAAAAELRTRQLKAWEESRRLGDHELLRSDAAWK